MLKIHHRLPTASIRPFFDLPKDQIQIAIRALRLSTPLNPLVPMAQQLSSIRATLEYGTIVCACISTQMGNWENAIVQAQRRLLGQESHLQSALHRQEVDAYRRRLKRSGRMGSDGANDEECEPRRRRFVRRTTA